MVNTKETHNHFFNIGRKHCQNGPLKLVFLMIAGRRFNMSLYIYWLKLELNPTNPTFQNDVPHFPGLHLSCLQSHNSPTLLKIIWLPPTANSWIVTPFPSIITTCCPWTPISDFLLNNIYQIWAMLICQSNMNTKNNIIPANHLVMTFDNSSLVSWNWQLVFNWFKTKTIEWMAISLGNGCVFMEISEGRIHQFF